MPTNRIPAEAPRAPLTTGPVSSSNPAAAVLRTPAVSNAWQLGTLLEALALSDSANGRVRLQIGARVVDAQTSLPLRSGQTLRLQVAETGRTVVLQSVDTAQHEAIKAGIRQSLPRQLPQTQVLAAATELAKPDVKLPPELQAAVNRLINTVRAAATLTQPQGLRAAVRDSGTFLESRLAQTVQSADRVTTVSQDWKAGLLRFRDQLAQLQVRIATAGAGRTASAPAGSGDNAVPVTAVVRSATNVSTVVAESKLPLPPATSNTSSVAGSANAPAKATGAIAQSVVPETNLQRQGAAVLQAAPPMRHSLPQPQVVNHSPALPGDSLALVSDLITKSDGALARVRLNQLASVTPDNSPRQVWLLELPLQHADGRAEVIPLRIERDDEGSAQQHDPAWTVDMAFDLGRRGALRARVALRAGRISASFWADVDATRETVQTKLQHLEDSLKKKEIDVGCLTCGGGQPVQPAAPESSLLETRA